MNSVDIFVGNYTIIDREMYEFWIRGLSAEDVVAKLKQTSPPGESWITTDLIMSDVLDHYRTYQMLERLLQHPTKFAEQQTLQIDPMTQRHIIETYYTFNGKVVREMLGKKLSSRNRKDLEENGEKFGISVKSCRRQFDNVKRVFKTVEDMRGSLVLNIQSNFLLSEGLAKKYAAIVFIMNNRFETSKRKLQYLSFYDFFNCASYMIANWSCGAVTQYRQEDTNADLDREYLQELREVKILLEKDILEHHRSLVCSRLKEKLVESMYLEMESSFKTISRTLVNIAYQLNHSREAKDIFIDLVEKFIEPCRNSKWTRNEMELFLTSYMECARQLDIFKTNLQLLAIWHRYISTASQCILCMFHA